MEKAETLPVTVGKVSECLVNVREEVLLADPQPRPVWLVGFVGVRLGRSLCRFASFRHTLGLPDAAKVA